MISRLSLACVCTCALSTTVASAAAVDLQVFGGSRESGFKPEETKPAADQSEAGRSSDRFTGIEYGVGAMTQPTPLAPLSIGFVAVQQHLKGNSGKYQERISGSTIGARVSGWVDFGRIQPFASFVYDLYSDHKYVAEYDQPQFFAADAPSVATRMEMHGRVRGYHAGVGVRLRSTDSVGAFVQADLGREVLQVDSAALTQDGFGFTARAGDVPRIALDSRSLMIGVELGI